MHIVAIAWIFVVGLMTLAEATSPQGTLLGAFFTLVLYGVLPLGIVLYLMASPARRRTRLAAETPPTSTAQGNGSGQAARDRVAPVREEA